MIISCFKSVIFTKYHYFKTQHDKLCYFSKTFWSYINLTIILNFVCYTNLYKNKINLEDDLCSYPNPFVWLSFFCNMIDEEVHFHKIPQNSPALWLLINGLIMDPIFIDLSPSQKSLQVCRFFLHNKRLIIITHSLFFLFCLEIDGRRAVAFRRHGSAWACTVFYLEIRNKRKNTLALHM